jgi:hypothetical protein
MLERGFSEEPVARVGLPFMQVFLVAHRCGVSGMFINDAGISAT